jgi:hypothetical protein
MSEQIHVKQFLYSNNSKSLSFHSDFVKFRQNLNFKKQMRKLRIDSILKKCKSKMFKAVQESVNCLLNLHSKQNRLPQAFITDINIESNKLYFGKCIIEIYKEFELLSSFEEIAQNFTVVEGKKDLLRGILSMTYKEAYESYLCSMRYLQDLSSIKMREGEKYAELFNYVAKMFLPYYSYGKGNITRILETEKKHFQQNFHPTSD